jgi:large subunit ribosomal protein L35
MPKMKTHKGMAKRFKVTATGKVVYHRPGKSHLLSVKTGKRKRKLRRPQVVRLAAFAKKFKRALGES